MPVSYLPNVPSSNDATNGVFDNVLDNHTTSSVARGRDTKIGQCRRENIFAVSVGQKWGHSVKIIMYVRCMALLLLNGERHQTMFINSDKLI